MAEQHENMQQQHHQQGQHITAQILNVQGGVATLGDSTPIQIMMPTGVVNVMDEHQQVPHHVQEMQEVVQEAVGGTQDPPEDPKLTNKKELSKQWKSLCKRAKQWCSMHDDSVPNFVMMYLDENRLVWEGPDHMESFISDEGVISAFLRTAALSESLIGMEKRGADDIQETAQRPAKKQKSAETASTSKKGMTDEEVIASILEKPEAESQDSTQDIGAGGDENDSDSGAGQAAEGHQPSQSTSEGPSQGGEGDVLSQVIESVIKEWAPGQGPPPRTSPGEEEGDGNVQYRTLNVKGKKISVEVHQWAKHQGFAEVPPKIPQVKRKMLIGRSFIEEDDEVNEWQDNEVEDPPWCPDNDIQSDDSSGDDDDVELKMSSGRRDRNTDRKHRSRVSLERLPDDRKKVLSKTDSVQHKTKLESVKLIDQSGKKKSLKQKAAVITSPPDHVEHNYSLQSKPPPRVNKNPVKVKWELRSKPCPVCSKLVRLKCMREHMIVHKPKDHKPWKCEVCDAGFRHKGSLRIHERIHLPEKPFKCDQCPKAFLAHKFLRYHLERHERQKEQDLAAAGQEVPERKRLKIPGFDRKKETVLCEYCAKEFLATGFKKHLKRCHPNGEISLRKTSLKGTKVKLPGNWFPCPICECLYAKTSYLKKHISKAHQNEDPAIADAVEAKFIVPDGDKKRYKSLDRSLDRVNCDICQKSVIKKNIHRHLAIHTGEKPFECTSCDQAYRDAYALKRHKMLNHGMQDPFKCVFCDSTFRNRVVATRHAKFLCPNNPEREKNLKEDKENRTCPYCNKTLSRNNKLKRHINDVHLKVNSFPCEICGHVFSRKGDMLNHVKAHSNLGKDHVCNVCGKSFRARSNMLQHQRRKHMAGLAWRCMICEGGFPTRAKLRQHEEVHEGEILASSSESIPNTSQTVNPNEQNMYVKNEHVAADAEITYVAENFLSDPDSVVYTTVNTEDVETSDPQPEPGPSYSEAQIIHVTTTLDHLAAGGHQVTEDSYAAANLQLLPGSTIYTTQDIVLSESDEMQVVEALLMSPFEYSK